MLDIEFNPVALPPVSTPRVANLLVNSGFENGPERWVATDGVVTDMSNEPAHSGTWKAWLGGYGTAHTDRIYQEVALPGSAHAITLTFWIHISTEEQQPEVFDRLTVAVRRPAGALIKTLTTLSNQNAAPGFKLKSFDLTPYKGQTVRIYFTGVEDNGSLTSFVIDDVRILVE